MAKLRHPSDVPPCGWQYLEPRTRLTLTGDNLADLVSQVHTHRQHNGFPDTIEQARLDVQRQICSKLGTRECVPEGPDDPWKPVHDLTRTASVSEILAFSRAALEWLMGGREIVPLEVNEARRKTCAACPMNQPVQGCRCAPLYRMVDRAIPEDRRTCRSLHHLIRVSLHWHITACFGYRQWIPQSHTKSISNDLRFVPTILYCFTQ